MFSTLSKTNYSLENESQILFTTEILTDIFINYFD